MKLQGSINFFSIFQFAILVRISIFCIVKVPVKISRSEGDEILIVFLLQGWSQDTDFNPQVTATCKMGHMSIRVVFNSSFHGAIHARDYRNPSCMAHGDGGKVVTLDINLLALHDTPDYCGLLVNNVSHYLIFKVNKK